MIESRYKKRLRITGLILPVFLLTFTATICGCHFSIGAVLATMPPLVWGFYALSTYRDHPEQITGWLAFAVGIFSLALCFEESIKFLFI